MKKTVLLALCIVLLLVSACGQQQNLVTSSPGDGEHHPYTSEALKTEESSSTKPVAINQADITGLSPLQAFTAVLQSEIPFLYIDQDRGETHNGTSYEVVYRVTERLDALTQEDSIAMSPPCFAVVDMDGDGVGEVIYQRSDYLGYIVLRVIASDKVIGYSVNYRAMQDLKADGSFLGAGGADISYIEKMRFLGEHFDNDCLANQSGEAFWIHGEPVDKDAYIAVVDALSSKLNATWRAYSQDAIALWLARDLNDIASDRLSASIATERQCHLDAFADMLWFNYNTRDTYISRAENSRRYFDDWNTSMEQLLALCTSSMSTDEANALHDDQQRWLSVRDKAGGAYAQADPATKGYHLGRMTQLRVYHLISLYYNDHFYD